jgi:DNA-binding ferritin-like protein
MSNDDLLKKLYKEIERRKLLEQEEDDDMDDDDQDDEDFDNDEENDNEQESSSSNDFCEMVSQLLHSKTQTHIYHLSVKGSGSYAIHKALQTYYESIDGLVDGLTESYQGKYGLLKNYSTFDVNTYTSLNDVIDYFDDLNEMIEDKRDCCDNSYIQNQIDTVQELIYSTLYKLKFLK